MRTKLLTVLITATLLSYHTFSQDENWKKITDIKGGYVEKILIDSKGNLYSLTRLKNSRSAATDYITKLYLSRDNGINWTLLPNLPADFKDFVIDNDKVVGVGGTNLYFFDELLQTWTVKTVTSTMSFHQLFLLSPDQYLVNALHTCAFYSAKTGEVKLIEGLFIDRVTVTDNSVYIFNIGNATLMRSPLRTNIADWKKEDWQTVFNPGANRLFKMTVSGSRIFVSYQDAGYRFALSYASLTNPTSWTSLPLPFSQNSFRSINNTDIELNTSPAGNVLLSVIGYEEIGVDFLPRAKMYDLNTTTLTWSTAKKYPGDNLRTSTFPAGFIWKSESEIFTGADGLGILRSTDGGVTWSLRNGNSIASINDVVGGRFIKVSTGRILFVVEKKSKGYFYSDDQGETWTYYTPRINGSPVIFYTFLSLSNTAVVATTTEFGLYGNSILYTLDGLNWIVKNSNVQTFKLAEVSDRIISVDDSYSSIKYSTDQGASWQNIAVNGLQSIACKKILVYDKFLFLEQASGSTITISKINTNVSPWSSEVILTLSSNWGESSGLTLLNDKLYIGDGENVYISYDLGNTFNTISFSHKKLAPIYENTGGIGLSKRYSCTVTQDDGSTFTNLSTQDAEINEFLRTNDGKLLASSEYGPVLKSKQALIKPNDQLPDKVDSEWIQLTTGLNELNIDFNISKNNLLLSQQSNYAYSTNDGTTWVSSSAKGKLFQFENELISINNARAFSRSIDNGITFTSIADYPDLNFIQLTKATDNQYFSRYGSPQGIKLGYSVNLTSWTELQHNLTSTELGNASSFHSINGYLITLTGGKIMRGSLNATNTNISFSWLMDLGSVQKLVYKNNKLYAFSIFGNVHISEDGINWITKLCPSGNSFYAADQDYLFITSRTGNSYISRDGGDTWQLIGFKENTDPINIVVNKNTGYGFIALTSGVVYKSSQVLIKNDKQTPKPTSLVPANLASDVRADYKIELRFSESVSPIAGKQIKIYEQGNLSAPVEVIDVTQGVRDDNTYTYTPLLANASSKTYFILIDAGSFIDLYNEVYAGINTVFQWSYSMQDITPPQITHAAVNLQKGSLAKLQVDVTDNNILPTDKTKILYRGITKPSTETFSPAVLLALSGVGTNNLKMEISLPESAYDAMGIEYYFESEDVKGNKVRSPLAENTFYYSYIEYPAPNQPKINQALSFGGELANYRIVSFPYEFADNATPVVLKTLQPYDKSRWRMYGYGSDTKFIENPELIERGKGYWMNIKNPIDVLVEGAKNPVNNKTSFFSLELKPGWNLVGNPYPTAISWNEVKSTYPAISSIKIFGGNGYENGDVLAAHQGGFVFVNGTSDIDVKVRFRNILTGGRIGKPQETVTEDNWILPLLVQSGNSQNSIGGIGMKVDAEHGRDNYDDLNPPSFFNYCQIESTDELTQGLARSVVASAAEYAWSFAVKTTTNEQTKLSWDSNITSALSREVFLLDVSSQTLVDMRTYSAHNLTGNSFRIYYGEQLGEKIKPTMASLHVTPNPATDFVEVSYSLPDNEMYTRIELIDQLGRTVEILENGSLQSGFYKQKVNISLLDQHIYIVRMSTRSTNGNTVISKKLLKLK